MATLKDLQIPLEQISDINKKNLNECSDICLQTSQYDKNV